MMKYTLIPIFLFTLVSGSLSAQNVLQLSDQQVPLRANLSQLAWIAGHWEGEAMGGYIEEIWTLPSGGAMMGSFRMVSEGKADFYELCLIRQVGESATLYIKHFNDDLTGWEEKDKSQAFRLVKLENQTAWFEGITFERKRYQLFITVLTDEGQEPLVFEYKLQQ